MYRAVLAAWLSLVLLAWPAHAQTTYSGSTERVVFEGTVAVIPPTQDGSCLRLDPGQLTVRARNTGLPPQGDTVPELRPIGFRLFGSRGTDPNGRIDLPVTRDESVGTALLAGGLYCWLIDVDAPVSIQTPLAKRTSYTQFVDVTMTWAPQ